MPRLSTRPRAVLFDLDGTLADPAPGITRCLAHALTSIGVEVPSYDQLVLAIGPPWEDYLPTLGVPPELVDQALINYRAEYESGGLFEATVYDGIAELLGNLVSDGFELALATSKPIGSATRVVEHFGLSEHFTFLGGATLDGSRVHKHDVISHVLDTLGHRDAVMIGDRKYDIEGARHHGLACIGVEWGHAPADEFAAHRPAATVASAQEIRSLLAGLPNP
jgi:phosphoglycolate phosphatase